MRMKKKTRTATPSVGGSLRTSLVRAIAVAATIFGLVVLLSTRSGGPAGAAAASSDSGVRTAGGKEAPKGGAVPPSSDGFRSDGDEKSRMTNHEERKEEPVAEETPRAGKEEEEAAVVSPGQLVTRLFHPAEKSPPETSPEPPEEEAPPVQEVRGGKWEADLPPLVVTLPEGDKEVLSLMRILGAGVTFRKRNGEGETLLLTNAGGVRVVNGADPYPASITGMFLVPSRESLQRRLRARAAGVPADCLGAFQMPRLVVDDVVKLVRSELTRTGRKAEEVPEVRVDIALRGTSPVYRVTIPGRKETTCSDRSQR